MFTIWVTKACNMRCRYCYEGIEKENEFMTRETADAVIEWMLRIVSTKKREFYFVRFHGGEPLLNAEIIKYIIEKLKESTSTLFAFQITTNGYNLTSELLEYLSTNMSMIAVSLDGKKESNDKNRVNALGESTFENVLRNAKELQKQFPSLQIRMTVNSKTCNMLAENVLYLIEEGFTNINAETDCFDEDWTMEGVDVLEQECRSVYRALTNLDIETNVSLPIGFKPYKKSSCTGGIEEFNIDTKGNIYPCTYAVGEEELCIGNVREGVVSQWQRELRQMNAIEMKTCDGCGGYDSCVNTRCRIVNKKITGEYGSPIPLLCELHRRNIKFIC